MECLTNDKYGPKMLQSRNLYKDLSSFLSAAGIKTGLSSSHCLFLTDESVENGSFGGRVGQFFMIILVELVLFGARRSFIRFQLE